MVGVLTVVGLAVVGGMFCGLWIARAMARSRSRQAEAFAIAKRAFRLRREYLEARFITLASQGNRAGGFSWGDCDFADEVAFARDRGNGELRALVGMTIFFETTGEDSLNVVGRSGRAASVLAATAVFRYVGGQWISDGHAIFNLDPGQAMRRFGHRLEAVE
jgi:hypothetical protein